MAQQYTAEFKARVVREALKEDKTITELASLYGIHPKQVRSWKALALADLGQLFERRDIQAQERAVVEKEQDELYARIGRLTTQIEWVKKNLALCPRAERVQMVERSHPRLSVQDQAGLVGLSRASLYYHAVGPSPTDVAIKHRIDEIYTEHPFYGSRRLSVVLQGEGWSINRKAVQRHMREMQIAGIAPGPQTSRPHPTHPVYPYLLRHVTANRPNHVWGIDITYIRLARGWMYLVAVLDWHTRYVVSWDLDDSLEQGFVHQAVDQALGVATPTIWNSDQGSHFTSVGYLGRLQAAGVQISMDGKGRALDNIFTERLWRSVKYEEVYLAQYQTPRDARTGLATYFRFYNHERPHQALDYRTPAAVYGASR